MIDTYTYILYYTVLYIHICICICLLGCILYCLSYFKQPFQDEGPLGIINLNYQIPPAASQKHHTYPKYSKYLIAMIKKLLTPSPLKRPDIQQVATMCRKWETYLNTQHGGRSGS